MFLVAFLGDFITLLGQIYGLRASDSVVVRADFVCQELGVLFVVINDYVVLISLVGHNDAWDMNKSERFSLAKFYVDELFEFGFTELLVFALLGGFLAGLVIFGGFSDGCARDA